MKRCIVQFRDGSYCNIKADTLRISETDDNIILASVGDDLVGAFDMSAVLSLYLSEMKE